MIQNHKEQVFSSRSFKLCKHFCILNVCTDICVQSSKKIWTRYPLNSHCFFPINAASWQIALTFPEHHLLPCPIHKAQHSHNIQHDILWRALYCQTPHNRCKSLWKLFIKINFSCRGLIEKKNYMTDKTLYQQWKTRHCKSRNWEDGRNNEY